MKSLNRSTGNRPSPMAGRTKLNKVLLVINIVLCLALIGLAVGYYCYYELTVCMLLMALVTGYNAFWVGRTLRGDRKK